MPTRLTLSKINKAIAKYEIELVKGSGYFYFMGLTDNGQRLADKIGSVYAMNLQGMSYEQWIDYIESGIKESFEIKSFKNYLIENQKDFLAWKRKNVTLRGVKTLGKDNNVYSSFGKGLYTAALSNKSMAKQYGDVYFVVNAIPKNPKIVDSLNLAEILMQKIVHDFCKKHGQEYSLSFFDSKTSLEAEMMKMGYDGLIIKGREMVHYKPKGIVYIKTENELKQYFENLNQIK
jgi:hypothetical protein